MFLMNLIIFGNPLAINLQDLHQEKSVLDSSLQVSELWDMSLLQNSCINVPKNQLNTWQTLLFLKTKKKRECKIS